MIFKDLEDEIYYDIGRDDPIETLKGYKTKYLNILPEFKNDERTIPPMHNYWKLKSKTFLLEQMIKDGLVKINIDKPVTHKDTYNSLRMRRRKNA